MGAMGTIPGYQSTGPRTIGRYLLHREIASGGMATVHMGWLAGGADASQVVAIKRLHPQFAKDPDFVEMFLDEARLGRRIFHPNVIQVIDVEADCGELFLVMEYVRGASLSFLLRRGRATGSRMPVAVAVSVIAGVLRGLNAAHEATDEDGRGLSIVHRDVSPQNIMVGVDGVSRVFDFGIAKAVGRLQISHQGQLKGKLSYMAPEQIDDHAVSRRTDVYAASVVLWEVLTGRRLFHAEDQRSTLAQVLAAEVPRPSSIVPGLPEALEAVVLRGLDRTPMNRYETALAMAEALENCFQPASAAEVGEWVRSLANEELSAHAEHAALIERSPFEARAVSEPPRPSPSTRDASIPGVAVLDLDSQISETSCPKSRRAPGDTSWWPARSGVAVSARAPVPTSGASGSVAQYVLSGLLTATLAAGSIATASGNHDAAVDGPRGEARAYPPSYVFQAGALPTEPRSAGHLTGPWHRANAPSTEEATLVLSTKQDARTPPAGTNVPVWAKKAVTMLH